MTAKQQRFVAEYLVDLNATQAAIRCGYSPKTAYAQGSRLLKHVEVAAAVAKGQDKAVTKAELSAQRVLEELGRLAFADVRGLFDDKGNLKAIKDLSDDQAASVASVEVIHRNLTAGDDMVDTIYKLKTWDKPRSLEMLAKHFALLTERVEHSGGLDITWKTSE